MAASASVVVAMKTLFSVLSCVMFATIVWSIATDGFASCLDLSNRWFVAEVINFFVNFGVIWAWIFYKESNWIVTTVFLLLAVTVGSTVTCACVAIQFFKLSPEESSSRDPLYFVLVKHQKKDAMGHRRGPSVLTARVIISALGCLMLATFIYVLIVDGSPFHARVFSPCMITATIDFYIHSVVIAVWVAYKESSWISALLWILSLVCFQSVATCVYIVRQLFYLSPQQPASDVLFNSSNKDLWSSDPLLVEDTNV